MPAQGHTAAGSHSAPGSRCSAQVTDHFILDSACHAAEQTLLDQQLFTVSGSQYGVLIDMLDQPPKDNAGLSALFARKASWDAG